MAGRWKKNGSPASRAEDRAKGQGVLPGHGAVSLRMHDERRGFDQGRFLTQDPLELGETRLNVREVAPPGHTVRVEPSCPVPDACPHARQAPPVCSEPGLDRAGKQGGGQQSDPADLVRVPLGQEEGEETSHGESYDSDARASPRQDLESFLCGAQPVGPARGFESFRGEPVSREQNGGYRAAKQPVESLAEVPHLAGRSGQTVQEEAAGLSALEPKGSLVQGSRWDEPWRGAAGGGSSVRQGATSACS